MSAVLSKPGRSLGGVSGDYRPTLPPVEGPAVPKAADIAAAYADARVQAEADPFAAAEAAIDAAAAPVVAWALSRLPAGSSVALRYARQVRHTPYAGPSVEVEWSAFVSVAAGPFEAPAGSGYATLADPFAAMQAAVLEALDKADAKAKAAKA